ncbi:sensor histidine kinase [Phenylobacterium soli]|uniref:sensor histidine kinase n=1 Tax=Phenylobacterium soli TaxID=2170551 RepID=UPI001D03ED4A|nr:HAMP domain-containing sensor histidine kinase [Phenylobacterium soli]
MEAQKRSFLRMVSHELRTPLNSILGFSEILAGELYGPLGAPQYKEYAEIIRESGHKLLKLVNQVLEIARLEGNAVEWDLRPEPVGAAVEEALTGLSREVDEHGTKVVLAGGETALPQVVADARGLRNALSALIHNAIVFSPQGSEVRIAARQAGRWVDIEIANPFPNADPDDLARLLKPFEQGESALTRAAEGAGLGLPICALTCQAMGGRLTLAAERGQRITATVRLPAA